MSKYPIKPSDIETKGRMWSAFGDMDKEISARYLVQMAQEKGNWADFTQGEIDKFCGYNFSFNGLPDGSACLAMIRKNADGTFSFTHKFVASCFLASPATSWLLE